MFFDCVVKFRLREKELDRAVRIIKRDGDLKDLSHFMRVALIHELNKRENNDEEVVDYGKS